jgi:hypothetical protein
MTLTIDCNNVPVNQIFSSRVQHQQLSSRNNMVHMYQFQISFYVHTLKKIILFCTQFRKFNARLHEDMQHLQLGGMLGRQSTIFLPTFHLTFKSLSLHFKPYFTFQHPWMILGATFLSWANFPSFSKKEIR